MVLLLSEQYKSETLSSTQPATTTTTDFSATSRPVMSLVERVASLEADNKRLRAIIDRFGCSNLNQKILSSMANMDIMDVTLTASVVALILVVAKALR